jgi:hypothetical protein
MEGSVTSKPLSFAQGGQGCSIVLLEQPVIEEKDMDQEPEAI